MKAPWGSKTKDIKAYWKRYGAEWRKRNPNYMRDYARNYKLLYGTKSNNTPRACQSSC
jgi:hypothetical protein